MEVHHPHPFNPKNKAVIHRRWVEKRMTKCPVPGTEAYNFEYTGEFVEYTFIDKRGKKVYVPEFCLWVKDNEVVK